MELQALIRKRGSLKSKITVFKNFLSNISISNPDAGIRLEENTRSEISARLIRLKETLDQYDELQSAIDALTQDLAETLEYRESFENEYFTLLTSANSFLARGMPTALNAASPRLSDNASRGEQLLVDLCERNPVSVDAFSRGVRLPTIELPKFGGDILTWMGFRDTFDSLIHKNASISEIQKFHYLKAALEGSAGQIVKSIEFSAANYEVAWSTLCNRFNNDKMLIHNHIKAIFEIEPVKRESSEQIQNIIDNLAKHLRALNALGEATEYWDSLLIYIISNKLDAQALRAWEVDKLKLEGLPSLLQFTNFLNSRARLLQTLEYRDQHVTSGAPVNHKHRARTRTLVSTSERERICALCKANHFIQNCPSFMAETPRVRAEKLKEFKLCLNCLRPGHFASKCTFGPCKKCGAKHNTLIHFEGEIGGASTVSLCSSDASGTRVASVLLSTAMVRVRGPNTASLDARMMLDSCSQSNFITEELCNALKLKKVPISVSVDMLNGTEWRINDKCEIEVYTRHNNFKMTLTCLIIPKITGAIPNSKLNLNSINIPRHLRLADPSFDTPGWARLHWTRLV